jgi:hypothetical protein
MKILLSALLLLFALPCFAQTPDPTPPPVVNGWNVLVNGAFSSANGATNNGFALTEELAVSPHFALRADEYLLNSPNVTVALGGVEYRIPGTAIFKASNFAVNASKLTFFVNGELGDAHATVPDSSPITQRHFAVGIGGGFDLCVSATVCLRPLDLKYVNGGVMTNGGKVLGNGLQFSSGINLRF